MSVCSVQPEAEARAWLPDAQFADVYSLTVPNPDLTAREAARKMWGSSRTWMNALMDVRNLAVAPFGLKRPEEAKAGTDRRIGMFPVVSETPNRVVLGFDDKHLDFRVIVDTVPLCRPAAAIA